jgi:hypothetical protein
MNAECRAETVMEFLLQAAACNASDCEHRDWLLLRAHELVALFSEQLATGRRGGRKAERIVAELKEELGV